jgi:hypothetical protein
MEILLKEKLKTYTCYFESVTNNHRYKKRKKHLRIEINDQQK